MTMPTDVGVIDLMMGIPEGYKKDWYEFLRAGFMDDESGDMEFPVQYMFKGVPEDIDEDADPVAVVLGEMDHFGIERAMLGVHFERNTSLAGARRSTPTASSAPSRSTPTAAWRASASSCGPTRSSASRRPPPSPPGMNPQVPINDKRFYPLYAKCIELDIPICITTGVPGPRVPMLCQKTELLDEVCWFFPELKVVMRHGAEPWDELAVKLMLKWPNLYYSTSAFAPKYYPQTIIDYANTPSTA